MIRGYYLDLLLIDFVVRYGVGIANNDSRIQIGVSNLNVNSYQLRKLQREKGVCQNKLKLCDINK